MAKAPRVPLLCQRRQRAVFCSRSASAGMRLTSTAQKLPLACGLAGSLGTWRGWGGLGAAVRPQTHRISAPAPTLALPHLAEASVGGEVVADGILPALVVVLEEGEGGLDLTDDLKPPTNRPVGPVCREPGRSGRGASTAPPPTAGLRGLARPHPPELVYAGRKKAPREGSCLCTSALSPVPRPQLAALSSAGQGQEGSEDGL